MDRRGFLAGMGSAILAAPLAAEPQQVASAPRIGILRSGSPPDPLIDTFRQGLRELGYVEGRNIVLEYRWAKGREEQLPALAADLVRLKVDVIVTSGAPALLASKRATSQIPIVMAVTGDPVGLGLVASFARPGGNFTDWQSRPTNSLGNGYSSSRKRSRESRAWQP
jgi:putative ABC transport system substrate-binding protein